MKNLYLIFVFSVFILFSLSAQEVGTSYEPIVSQNTYFDVSLALTEIGPIAPKGASGHHQHKNDPGIPKLNHETIYKNQEGALPKGNDPAWQIQNGSRGLTPPILNFQGVRNDDNGGYSDLVAPPDTDGDVGPNHYFQMCNTIFEIFDKSGTTLFGPADNSTIWSGFVGDWTGTNDGDPIVLYDEQADRWLVSQFAVDTDITGGTYWVLVAISATANPTGSYYRYAFEFDSYPDYPKFGIWRDGYYVMVQHGNGSCTAAALNRSQMLVGQASVTRVSFAVPNLPGSGFAGMLPADNDGDWAPVGTPNYFMYFSDDAWGDDPYDRLKIWEFDVNWTFPYFSSLTLTQNLNTLAFSSAFGGHNEGIIPQPGTTRKLAVVEKALMNRLQYRNFGSYESMVCCHTVDVNGSNRAGTRWYELRKTTGSWYIYQQGTYAPGITDNYWMASIAQNASGDIALGFSVSSSSTYPSIRYTGRRLGDALGLMTMGEQAIINGDDSQEGTSRWGDYTMMSVDPSDDETFWYTNEYNDDFTTWGNWITQIASFQIDEYCIASGGCDEYIVRVEVGTINNSSGCTGYANYMDMSTDIPVNSSEAIIVTNGNTNYDTDQCGIWVDWNDDGDFVDANETLAVSGSPGVGPYFASISPPAGTTMGEKKMRIRITYNQTPNPCGTTSFGEVEDYTINVSAAVPNYWTGGFNFYWHNAGNWSLGHIPTSSEDVIITNDGYHPPTTGAHDETVKNLTIQPGSALKLSTGKLYVNEDMNIYGEYRVITAGASTYCYGDVNWYSGSTADFDAYNAFWVWGNMEFFAGSNVQMADGTVAFSGTSTSWIRNKSANTSFYNLGSYKSIGSFCWISDMTTQDVTISNNLYIHPNAHFGISSDFNVSLMGDIQNNGTFNFLGASNTGTFVFDGTNQTIVMNSPEGVFNNVRMSSTEKVSATGDVSIAGNLLIQSGQFDPGGNTVTITGNWQDNMGSDGFVEANSRVIFNGPGHQYINGDENFNILEVNNGAALRLNNANYDVVCNSYDWTSGGIDIIAGNFTALDLFDNGLFGSYWVNPGGVINLTNNGWVDLRGELHNFGGTINVSGTVSDWPYGNNALLEMTGGVIDFKTCGITIRDNSYTLTTNISGGTIRTAYSFSNERSDIDLSDLTLEMYGLSNANLYLEAGSMIRNLDINKVAIDGLPETPQINRDGTQSEGGGRANNVNLTSNIVIDHIVNITGGLFTLNGYSATIGIDCFVYDGGILIMDNPADVLNMTNYLNWLEIQTGGTAILSEGNIHSQGWIIPREGSSFTASPSNTITFNGASGGGPSCHEPSAVYGNIVINKNPGQRAYIDNLATQAVVVNGDLTINADNIFELQNNTLIVHGDVTDNATSSIIVYDFSKNLAESSGTNLPDQPIELGTGGGILEIVTDFTLNGLLDIADGNVLVHGRYAMNSTGSMIINGGTFIADSPNHPDKGWEYINGSLEMSDGLFEITNNSTKFGASASTFISGGIIRTGGAFHATDSGVFEPTGGTVEFVGNFPDQAIYCYGGNYFYNLLINMEPGYFCQFMWGNAVDIKNDLTIVSGSLNTGTSDMFVGGNWTNYVGSDGFVENENVVWFYGETYSHILTDETFYELIIFDYLTDKSSAKGGRFVDETYIEDGVTVNATNDCKFLGGSLNMGINAVLDVDNNFIFNGGQCIVPGGTSAEIHLGGHYENYNPGQAFFPGASTFTFDGYFDQDITSNASTVYFNNLVIDNPGNLVEFFVNTYLYGDVEILNGKFVNNGPTHTNTFEGDINVEPAGAFLPKGIINFEGNENTVFNDQSSISSYLWGDVYIDKAADNLHLTILDDMIILNNHSVDVLTGVVNLNGGILRCTKDITIHDGGKMTVDAGAKLEVGDDAALSIQSGGILEVIGELGNPATITAWNSVLGHLYYFNVYAGGTLSASHAIFEYMKRYRGVHVRDGAIIDPLNSFNYCTFRHGDESDIGTAFLTINNNQTLTITGADFPSATMEYNVGKEINHGHITFVDYTGTFAGEDFDYDPHNRIDWHMDELMVTPPEQFVGTETGTTTFNISSNVEWTVSEDLDWLTVDPMSGTDDGILTVDYDENLSVTVRTGEITVSGEGVDDVTVLVFQAPADPELAVTPPERNVGAPAGSTVFDVQSNTNWWVSESTAWFTVDPPSSFGNGTITVNYDENLSTDPRSGEITLTSDEKVAVTVVVNQVGADLIHNVMLPEGWSGLSSYIMPDDNDIEDVFAPVSTNFIIAQTMTDIYYPAGPVNTIVNWDKQSAYKIKMNAADILPVIGSEESDKTFDLNAGWNLVPVISNAAVDAQGLFVGQDLGLVKDVAGLGILWPEYNINTIGDFIPGKAYYAMMNMAGSITFPANVKDAEVVNYSQPKIPANPWAENITGSSTHAIAVLSQGFSGVIPGDVIGIFAEDGQCYGISEIQSLTQNLAIAAFADDPYTYNQDGFEDGHLMTLKIYRPSTTEVFDVNATYDYQQANTEFFQSEGISVITSLKVSELGMSESLASSISIYPNPTNGMVIISGISDFEKIEIFNAGGEMLRAMATEAAAGLKINLSDLPAGVYQVKFTGQSSTLVKKLIRK